MRLSRELIPGATGRGEGAEAGVPLGLQAETWWTLRQGPPQPREGPLEGLAAFPTPGPPGPAQQGVERVGERVGP